MFKPTLSLILLASSFTMAHVSTAPSLTEDSLNQLVQSQQVKELDSLIAILP